MILFENTTKSFQQRQVIGPVSLSLKAHQTHVFIGESGSGKSTLLRLAAGLLKPTQGRVELNGRESSAISDADKALFYGYMVQHGGLFPHLTCEENIRLPARVHKLDEKVFLERYEKLSQMVALSPTLLKRFPRQLSGGQRQRVALVRALILDPDMIFLDEPLGALDPIVRGDLQTELKNIFHELKKSVVIVTHDLAEAAFFGDTLTLLNQGRVEQHGPLEDFFAQPKSDYVRHFLTAQRPPPNLRKGFDV